MHSQEFALGLREDFGLENAKTVNNVGLLEMDQTHLHYEMDLSFGGPGGECYILDMRYSPKAPVSMQEYLEVK